MKKVILLLFFGLCVTFASENLTQSPQENLKQAQILVDELKNNLKIGDLIFRKGLGMDSLVLSRLSDFEFSHVGIIAQINPEILIIHATTSDFGEESKNAVIESSLLNFIQNSSNFAVKRFKNLDINLASKVVQNARNFLEKPFVITPKGEPNLYCTTLLEKAFIGVLSLNLSYEQVSMPFFRGEYLFPKTFWELENLELVFIQKPI